MLLVPGFMASDQSLTVLKGWLRRRGSRAASAGMWINVDCGERTANAIEVRLERLAARTGREVVLIGQSRGGQLARVLAVRNPDLVGGLVMLGSPVLDPLQVGPAVLRAVRSVARLGDLGVPRYVLQRVRRRRLLRDLSGRPDRAVAADHASAGDLLAKRRHRGVAVLPRPVTREQIEVESSHSGMSVHRDVYRLLARFLDEEAQRWSG